MYSHGLSLASTLEHTSCLVSRTNPKKGIERPQEFFTLHQIAFKVIRPIKANLVEKLAGDRMKEHVEEALFRTFATQPNESLVDYYYSLIRSHKNSQQFLKESPNGSAVLANYQKILEGNFDWEDSLQTATWYFRDNKVKSLYEFPYRNIILVQPELLWQPRNKNALDFFYAWCTWTEEYTKGNAFLVDGFGYVHKFKNGGFEHIGHVNHFIQSNNPYKLHYTLG